MSREVFGMATPELSELNIQVSATDVTEEDIDQMTRQLLSELREMDVERAELTHGGISPGGTKAIDPVTVGSIMITVLPTLLPKVVEGIQAWVIRGNNRIVKFKGKIAGQPVEFEAQGRISRGCLRRWM